MTSSKQSRDAPGPSLAEILVESYVTAIRNAARYAVGLDPSITDPYRKELMEFATRTAQADARQIDAGKSDLRSIFRNYRDRADKYLTHLRSELTETATAFQTLAESYTAVEGDQDAILRKGLFRLREAALAIEDIEVRKNVLSAAETIELALDQLHKQHQATVAQFVTEMHLLHARIDQLEQAAAIDQMGSLLSRSQMEQRLLAPSLPLTLLLVKARHLRACETAHNTEIYAQMISAFVQRLRNGLPPNSQIGRWEDEQFLAITPATESEAEARARWASNYLSGSYVCRSGGKAIVPELEVSAGALFSQPHEDGPTLLRRIAQAFHSL